MQAVVLIVEDELIIAHGLMEELSEQDITTDMCCDPSKVLERIRSNPNFDAVLLDIRMPGEMNGLQLAAAIRDAQKAGLIGKELRLFTISGHFQPGDEGSQLFDGHFSKPVNANKLAQAIKAMTTTTPATVQGLP